MASEYHPEIDYPEDEDPLIHEGCYEVQNRMPQLIITNNFVAALMLNVFYGYINKKIDYDEIYLDVLTNSVRSVCRSKDIRANLNVEPLAKETKGKE